MNRLTSTKSKGEIISFTYAKTGAELSEQNCVLTTTFKYDNLGRLITQTESNNIVINIHIRLGKQ